MKKPSVLPIATPAESGLCPERAQSLLDALQHEVDTQRLPGAVVVIARHGKIALHQALGFSQADKAVAMTTDSVFRIYSMSKPVTSVAVMMLVEQGKLLLSDPVAKYLPEFAAQQVGTVVNGAVQLSPAKTGATVHDLLRHTAGLTYEFLSADPIQRQYLAARIRTDLRVRTNAEFTPVLASMPLIAEPGTVWEYSRATDVLGRLIEVISGQTLGVFLTEKILAPLGMPNTGFHVPLAQHDRIAQPFARDPDGAPQMRVFDVRAPAAFESGGGGLVSTAGDYARFAQFLLNRGELGGVRLLGQRTVDFMTTDHLGDIPVNDGGSAGLLPPGHGFGLGFAVRKTLGLSSVPGSVGLYYWGGLAGTTFFVDPALDLFALLMIQAPNQREHYRHLFRNLVYAALVD